MHETEAGVVDQSWRLQVQLYANEKGGSYFLAKLRSRLRPQILTRTTEPSSQGAPERLAAKVLMCADEQGMRHGDQHHQGDLQDMVWDALKKIQAEWGQNGSKIRDVVLATRRFDKPLITVTMHD